MTELFLDIVNMSISAGWLVLAVLVLRLILKKAPKWVNVLLWGIVAVRLICPFSIESALSLIPSRETISPEIMMDWTPEISTGIAPLDQVVNPVISTSFAPSPGASANPLQLLIPVAANLWLLGVIIMLAYTAISYLTLRRKLRTAVILRGNIFQCETVSSPFVLGIVKPRIYLPYSMDGKNLDHVVAHEQAHIQRKDHWWKPLGFLLLTVYWFNPLMWVAYILLCRDIELACDEKVIAELGNEQRADYTQALVACAVNRHMIAACPLAFGEVGVKDRVKSIMNYRKPTFWIIVMALVVCVVVAVCFLTNPIPISSTVLSGDYTITEIPYAVTVGDEISAEPPYQYRVTTDFVLYTKQNESAEWSCLGTLTPYELDNSELNEYMPVDSMRRDARVRKIIDAYLLKVENDNFYLVFQTQNGNTYLAYGWEDIGERGQPGSDDTRLRRLYLLERTSDSVVRKWFDYTEDPSQMSYEEELKIQLDEFPDITFKYTPYDIIATTSWEDSDLVGRTILISGLPIWNAYFCDLTGDGLPEVCSQVSYGSGMIDNRVIIFDYANGVSYKLEDRGYHDYYLRMNDADGYLYVDKRIYNSDELVSSGRLFFKDGCIQIDGASTDPVAILRAKILDIHDGYFLVEPVEGSWELNSASKIEVSMKNMHPSPEPQIGDILEIEYDGQIQETYPARITAVYGIRVISERPHVTEALTLNEVAELVKQQHTVSFVGMTREAVHGYWGEPDAQVHGFFGDIYHVPDSTESVIFRYDDKEIVESVIVEHQNDSEDWGLTVRLQFESETEFDIILTHFSANQTVEGTITTSPEYEIKVVHDGEIISFGNYMRNVLGYDYADTVFAWDTVLYTVEANGELIIDCNISTVYGSLPAGEYMLYKPVQLTTKTGETIIREYAIKFTIVSAGTELHIPEKEEILRNGYPINALGETFGPDIKEFDIMPDLILVRNESGVLGYIRAAEMEGNLPTIPNDAKDYDPVRTVNMYLQDGITVIGEFRLS